MEKGDKLAYANKANQSITSQKRDSPVFWRIANSVFSTKENLLYPLCSTALRCCLLDLIKRNCFLKTFLRTLILMNQLPVFSSRTNQKLHIISVTHKMIKKFRTNLDLSKASGPDYNPVVVLRNFESQLWDILAELFNICLKYSCFPNCWKVLSVVPVFPDVGERSTAKNYRSVSLLSVVSKAFEKLVNDSLVEDLEKIGLFLISNMVILLDQVQIFWLLYLIELLVV